MKFKENDIENIIIDLLEKQGYEKIIPSKDWDGILQKNIFINNNILREALKRINSDININDDILDSVLKEISNLANPSLFERNLQFQEYLTKGITINTKTKPNPHL